MASDFKGTKFYLCVVLIPLFFLWNCSGKNKLKTIKVLESGGAKISDEALVHVLLEEKDLVIELQYSQSTDDVIEKIINKEIDLAIIPNNSKVNLEARVIRTVTPLLPRMLMIFHKDEYKPSLNELLKGKKITYELTGSNDSVFYSNLVDHYALETDSYHFSIFDGAPAYPQIKSQLDSADVFITIGHMRNYLIDSLYAYGYELYPLDDWSEGNSLEGFALVYPQSYAYLIPENVFGGRPEQATPTLAIRDVLLCHKDISSSIIYDIVEVLSEKRNLLMQRDNRYNLLPFLNKETYRLTFPLHTGSLDYINRDKPNFIERYAEVMALVVSFGVLFIGFIGTLIRKQRIIKRAKN